MQALAPAACENVPLVQAVQTLAVEPEYCPAGQRAHVVAALKLEKAPPAQEVHTLAELLAE